ncbi:hypothetical protein C2G38_2168523 [Gigaspora rosea]|uniref:Uncharacterized protein n=1 Tax=Gigaspora rosea TaxID=44941 RepID=A0A397VRQ2_9GLOM|nr:hypothetical protein C2G38_2168523 [Gigaspora rosea]
MSLHAINFWEDNISSCPDNLYTKNLIPKVEVNHLINILKDAIKDKKKIVAN